MFRILERDVMIVLMLGLSMSLISGLRLIFILMSVVFRWVRLMMVSSSMFGSLSSLFLVLS